MSVYAFGNFIQIKVSKWVEKYWAFKFLPSFCSFSGVSYEG